MNNIVTSKPWQSLIKDEIYVIGKRERGSIVAFDIGGEEGVTSIILP